MSELVPIECEARLVGLSKQRRKDGDWIEVKFHIHPDDHPAALFILPLGTHCTLAVKGTEQSTIEETAETENTSQSPMVHGWEDAKRRMVQRAALICKETAFQQWIARGYKVMWNHERHGDGTDEDKAAYYVRTVCGVKSRADLDPAGDSGQRFRDIIVNYQASQEGRTDSALLDQRDRRQTHG